MEDTNHRRRALSNINPNILEVARKPCLINKRNYYQGTFAAQVVQTRSNQECRGETKDLLKLIGQNSEGDCDFVDLENSGDVPFFVKHTAAILDEVDEAEEVEMEDVDGENEEEEEPVIDIDDGDRKDPLFVVEYVNDIYVHYRKTERLSCVASNYMVRQPEINEKMRAILINWLIEVHHRFELMEETLFLTVNLIDRFLERRIVTRKTLQLVGVTAMLLACKYEEVSVPFIDDFVIITDKAYTKKDVLDMERVIVNTLQFNFTVPTPLVFIKRFLKTATFDKRIEILSHFMIELCLVEERMLEFSPSLLAAAAIYTAQCSVCRSKQWSKTSQCYTNYTQTQLLECSRMMVVFHQNAGKNKLTGVYTKYNTSKFGFAAKTEPADFLLLSF